MPQCFYESKFVKRAVQRQSLRIVLVQVASGILLWTNGVRSRKSVFFKDSMQPSLVLASAIPLAAWRSVEGKTLNKLLSVPVEDRTPNIVCAQGAKSFSGAAPSILRFLLRRPAL